jgi:hypothetical protein
MEAMVQEWTDGRLDELSDRVDRGFEQVDRRFEQVDRRFEHVEQRLDSIQRAVVFGVVALTTAMLAGFAAICTLIATTL